MFEKSSKICALICSLGNGRVWGKRPWRSHQCILQCLAWSWQLVLFSKYFQIVGELQGIPFMTMASKHTALFHSSLSFYIAVPYRSQSSSSNNSLKLLLAIFMSFFENLSCLVMLIFSIVTRMCVGSQDIQDIIFSSVQPLICVWLFATPRTAARQASLFLTNYGACSNSCPLNWWYHPTISYSDVPFSSCLQSFPTTGTFPMNPFFTSVGQSIGASALASILPMNIQNWYSLGWTGLISLQSKGLSRVFSNTTVQKCQIFSTQLSL